MKGNAEALSKYVIYLKNKKVKSATQKGDGTGNFLQVPYKERYTKEASGFLNSNTFNK